MWNLAKTGAIVAICLSATGGGWAQSGPGPCPPNAGVFRPITLVAVPNGPLRFGMVSGPMTRQLRAETVARVAANCPFRLVASFQGLTEVAGRQFPIPATQVTMRINGKEVPVGTDWVQIATGGATSPAGMEVPIVIEMQIQGASNYPAGRYGGNLALRIMPRL
jgi:hypothetical protein